jgi:hypothetical protein
MHFNYVDNSLPSAILRKPSSLRPPTQCEMEDFGLEFK